jgi:hypothetical protein
MARKIKCPGNFCKHFVRVRAGGRARRAGHIGTTLDAETALHLGPKWLIAEPHLPAQTLPHRGQADALRNESAVGRAASAKLGDLAAEQISRKMPPRALPRALR